MSYDKLTNSEDGHELARALRGFGYNLSPIVLSLIEQKYCMFIHGNFHPSLTDLQLIAAPPSGNNYGPPPGISFDRFVRACVTVKTMKQLFDR